MPQRYITSRHDIELKDREYERAMRAEFLESCRAIPTPREAYAVWQRAYLRGWKHKVTHPRDYAFTVRTHAAVQIGVWNDTNMPAFDYSDTSVSEWMPTMSTNMPIPIGYGANSLGLLILTDHVKVPHKRMSEDSRPGWEWGHTVVRTLAETRNNRQIAWTNDANIIESFPDVTEIVNFLNKYHMNPVFRNKVDKRLKQERVFV